MARQALTREIITALLSRPFHRGAGVVNVHDTYNINIFAEHILGHVEVPALIRLRASLGRRMEPCAIHERSCVYYDFDYKELLGGS